MLFRPFDIAKWFVIGFCAWLAQLGESGGFHGNFGNFNHKNNTTPPDFRHVMQQVHDFIIQNLYWLLPVAIAVFLLLFAIGAVIVWLNSRGKFMLLHCVALDRAEVAEPWTQYASHGNSLFWFRFVLGLIGSVITLPAIIVIGVIIFRMVMRGEPDTGGIVLAAALFLLFLLVAIVFTVIQKFTADFVVPILYLRGGRCLDAWKEFYGLLSARPGLFALYILFQIVIAMAIGVIVLFLVLLTCCIAGCLMMIPYVGTVLLLPLIVFNRAYSLYFLQQFGPNYDVFPPAPPSPSTPVTGLQPLPGAPAA